MRLAVPFVIAGAIAIATPSPSHAVSTVDYSRVTDYRGLLSPAAPLAETLPALLEAAAEGDAIAATEAYAGVSKCRSLRSDTDLAAANLYCEGVPAATLHLAGDLLARAASLGDVDAQYVYALAGAQELLNSTEGKPSESDMRVYREHAVSYLENLSKHCNISAIQRIYREKRDGKNLFAPDMVGAYQMLTSLSIVKPDLVTAENLRQLENLMIPSDINKSKALAAQFVDTHCR